MRRASPALLAAALLGSGAPLDEARAATAEEIAKRYDFNGDGFLKDRELLVYQRHRNDPVLAKYDLDDSGDLEKPERDRLLADIDAKYGGPSRPASKPDPNAVKDDLINRGQQKVRLENGIALPVAALADPSPAGADACNPDQRLYIRRDRLDNHLYGVTPRASAVGASISVVNDKEAGSRSAQIDGAVSYVLARRACVDRAKGAPPDTLYLSNYAVAAWVEGHGVLRTGRIGETSSLKSGLDLQGSLFSGDAFNMQYFTVSPYAQTDYRGEARVAGASLYWEPYLLRAKLGGSYRRPSDLFDFYWQARVEGDFKHVDDPGATRLAAGDYAWMGGTVRAHLFPFPYGSPLPKEFNDRLRLTGTAQWYWNAYDGREISRYALEAAYNLDASGASSVSLSRNWGRDKDTLARLRQYLVKLNYKY